MTDDVDVFDLAYDGRDTLPPPASADPLAELLALAVEVGVALGRYPLTAADRERLYRRALSLAADSAAPGWHRRVHLPRRSAVVGGAAVVTALAAVGVVVVRERRHHGAGLAA